MTPFLIAAEPHDSQRLIDSFVAYRFAWRKRDISAVWNLMSPSLKIGSKTKENFEKYILDNGFYVFDFSKIEVIINGNTAEITSMVTYRDFNGDNLGSELSILKFIEINRKWYFDGFNKK